MKSTKAQPGGQLTSPPDTSVLSDLAERINQEHAKCEAAMNSGLKHLLEAGRLLIEAKNQVNHGDWLAWVEKHCDFTRQTASGYMRLAQRWPELEEVYGIRAFHLSYRQILKLLAEPKPEPQIKQAKQTTTLSTKALIGVVNVAQRFDVRPDDLADMVREMWPVWTEGIRQYNAAKRAAHKLTGLTPKVVEKLINDGHDYTSRVDGPIGQRLARLDVWAVEVARQYPELDLGNPDDPQVNITERLWTVLAQPKKRFPPKHDDRILRHAAQYLWKNQYRAGTVEVRVMRAAENEDGTPRFRVDLLPDASPDMQGYPIRVEVALGADPQQTARLLRGLAEKALHWDGDCAKGQEPGVVPATGEPVEASA